MTYRKDSGEGNFLKNVNPKKYTEKSNKDIFKKYTPEKLLPPVSHVSKEDWDIPTIDEIEVPELDDIDFDFPVKKENPKPQQDPNFFEYYKDPEKEQSNKVKESLSLKDIFFIVLVNMFAPIVGGFIYYIILSSKGSKQKATHSITLSAIVSIMRLIYLYLSE